MFLFNNNPMSIVCGISTVESAIHVFRPVLNAAIVEVGRKRSFELAILVVRLHPEQAVLPVRLRRFMQHSTPLVAFLKDLSARVVFRAETVFVDILEFGRPV